MTALPEKLEYVPWSWSTIACAYEGSDFYKELGCPDTIGQTCVVEYPGHGPVTYTLRVIREYCFEGGKVLAYDFSYEVS